MLKDYICAARVGLWLCRSALIVRRSSLPTVCRAASLRRPNHPGRLDASRVIAIVRRVCRLPLFSLPIFPRLCVRQSLALYRELNRLGYPAAIHFGVRREGAELTGHSWVTVNGVAIAEPHTVHSLAITYSYSAASIQPSGAGHG